MASINTALRTKVYTHEGAPAARNVSLRQQLERTVLSCLLWENEFYESGVEISKRIAELVAANKVEDVLEVAREAKLAMRLRHAPLYLAVELCKRKDARKEMRGLLKDLVTRPDDATEFLALYWKDGRKPIAKQVKLGLADSVKRFDHYQIAKYKNRGGKVKLRDILCLAHPKPKDEDQAKLFKSLLDKEVGAADTWETALSAKGNNAESWMRLINEGKLGGMATLRNLRNMQKADVPDDTIRAAIRGVKAGKLLPINFIAAAPHAPRFESLLEEKFFECFSSKDDKIGGRTIVLVDVSGSMEDKLSGRSELSRMDVACSLAMIARETFSDVGVYTFSHQCVEIPDRRGFALRDAIIGSQPHRGTYLGGAITALRDKFQFDRLIVITDEQSHDPVPRGVKGGYLINVASNRHGVGYDGWVHIDGWSDKVVEYIVKYEEASKFSGGK